MFMAWNRTNVPYRNLDEVCFIKESHTEGASVVHVEHLQVLLHLGDGVRQVAHLSLQQVTVALRRFLQARRPINT